MTNKSSGFWTSLPGILTSLAGLITALTGLYIAIQKYDSSNTNQPTVTSNSQAEKAIEQSAEIQVSPTEQSTQTLSKIETTEATETKHNQKEKSSQKRLSALQTGNAIDCQYFSGVDPQTSISQSNYYHKQIINRPSKHACTQAIRLRTYAYCSAPNDVEINQALSETLSLCKGINIPWEEVIPPQY